MNNCENAPKNYNSHTCTKLVIAHSTLSHKSAGFFTSGSSWAGPFKLHTMAKEDRIQRTK